MMKVMRDVMVEAIERAKRDLRWAEGGMTEEEKEEQRRATEVKEMKLFLSSTFGLQREHLLWYPKVVWYNNRASVEFLIEDKVFRLCPSGDDFRLETDDGKALTVIQNNDPNFASRVIVALGNVLVA